MISAGGESSHINLVQLQAAVAESDTMPMSKLFRQYRRRLNPEIYRELDQVTTDEEGVPVVPVTPRTRAGSKDGPLETSRSKDGSV